MNRKAKKPIKVLPHSYQPSPKQLIENKRDPDALIKAIMQDVNVVEKLVEKHKREYDQPHQISH